MTENECENLVFSMRNRCQEVIREKGYFVYDSSLWVELSVITKLLT